MGLAHLGLGERARRGPAPVLVVEGCAASVSPAGDLAAVRVWVDAPTELRRARGLARDGEVFAPYWDRWAAQEAALFGADRTRERADLVVLINGTASLRLCSR